MVAPAAAAENAAASAAAATRATNAAGAKDLSALVVAEDGGPASILQQTGSQESSPSKPLPPKTPALHKLDAAAGLPSVHSSPSSLAHGLRKGGPEAAAAMVTSSDDGEDDAMLLVHAPSVGPAGAMDPQLLVHSSESSFDGAALSAVAAPASPASGGQPQLQNGAAAQPSSAAVVEVDADAEGQCTPRARLPTHAPPPSVDLLSPSVEAGFSLADLLQGPAPPPHPSTVAGSPSCRPAFMHEFPRLAQLEEGGVALSPRPPPLPSCSPLMLTGLRDPPYLPGMLPAAPLSRPPMLPPGSAPGLSLVQGPGAAARPRPLPGSLPPGMAPAAIRRPLAPPLGRPAALVRSVPPPPATTLLRPNVGSTARPPLAAAPVMVPTTAAAGTHRSGGEWAPPADEFLTPEGVRLAMAAAPQEQSPASPSQQQQQQQQQHGSSGGGRGSALPGRGTAVPVQRADALHAPAGTAAFAAIKAEAAAGAAAAATAILAAPPTAAAQSASRPVAAPLPAAQPQAAAVRPAAAARRVAGGDPMQSPAFRAFLAMLRGSSTEFEARGRVLRLRQFLRADVGPRVLNAVLEALEVNTRVEALYIQNFEQGMLDEQLDRLVRLLRRGRIWALNVGENYGTSREAWLRFCAALPHTAVAHLFVSEAHLAGSDLKGRMRDAIRANRSAAPPRDPEVIVHVGNMWFNPRLPPAAKACSPRSTAAARDAAAAGPAAAVTVPLPAGAARDSLSGGGSGGGGGVPADADSAPSAGGARSGDGSATAAPPAADSGAAAAAAAEAAVSGGVAHAATMEAAGQQQAGSQPRAAPKRRQGADNAGHFDGDPPAKRSAAAAPASAGLEAATEAHAALPGPAAAAAAAATTGRRAGSGRRAGRPSAARLLLQQGGLSSGEDDGELDEAFLEGGAAGDDHAYLPFKAAAAAAAGQHLHAAAAPTRASRRIQRRAVQAYQGHLPMDDEFVTFDPGEEPASPPRTGGAARRGRSGPVGAPYGAVGGGGGRVAPPQRSAAAAKRSVQSAGARPRSVGGRQPSGELKGRPSFAELVESGFMQPGSKVFTVGMQDVHAALEADGTILYAGTRYRAISKFALVVLRERNPSRQSCDGWKEVALHGEKLDVLRARFQSHQRRAAARKASSAAAAVAAGEQPLAG